jgi:hypothetical protein
MNFGAGQRICTLQASINERRWKMTEKRGLTKISWIGGLLTGSGTILLWNGVSPADWGWIVSGVIFAGVGIVLTVAVGRELEKGNGNP